MALLLFASCVHALGQVKRISDDECETGDLLNVRPRTLLSLRIPLEVFANPQLLRPVAMAV